MNAPEICASRRVLKRRRSPFELFEPDEEIAEKLIIEPGTDPSGITQCTVLFIHSEQQRAETQARAGRIGKASDYELLVLRAFNLHP